MSNKPWFNEARTNPNRSYIKAYIKAIGLEIAQMAQVGVKLSEVDYPTQ